MKAGEQPQEALRRELREEIGLEVEKLEIFSARTFSKPRQIEIIFFGSSNGQPQPQSMEVELAGWFATSSLPEGLPDDQRRLIERAVMNGADQGD